MTDPTLFSTVIPEEERLRRIGAFVCRVAQLAQPSPPAEPTPPVVLADAADPDERVLAFLGRGREASPVEIRLSLGLSRSMTYRALQRLVLTGRVLSRGRTKAVVYGAVPADLTRN
ncbi:MAG: hypothetical protein JNG82_11325 [Opitutaceae bacterium]|nr:hypothetical protein [Opitutaceae bacterium]